MSDKDTFAIKFNISLFSFDIRYEFSLTLPDFSPYFPNTGVYGDESVKTIDLSPSQADVSTSTTEEEKTIVADDLTKISGIGEKTATILQDAGITTYAQLAATTVDTLKQILSDAGSKSTPDAWPEEAKTLVAGA